MKTKPSHSVGLAALSYALVLLSGEAVAKNIPSVGSCTSYLLGDGNCDKSQNIEACGYDGGDCCECTCNSTATFACRFSDFACVDPSASCVNDSSVINGPGEDTVKDGRKPTGLAKVTKKDVRKATSTTCTDVVISDGDCDIFNNNEECGYDGGDCCECTCVSTEELTCGDQVFGGFTCLDPSAPCVDDDDATTLPRSETRSDIYDGGDCCECTCVSTNAFTCGDNGGFECIDPNAPCVDDDDVTTLPESDTYVDSTDSESTTSLSCVPEFFSDGDCDPSNNNQACGYDGGDCCRCTRVGSTFACGDRSHGGFDCIYPGASFIADDDDITILVSDESSYTGPTSGSSCVPDNYSDANCDHFNNNKYCGYDGGDCCACTCVSSPRFTCGDNGGFDCIDPSSPWVDIYVEAGTKTTIGVSTNIYDNRPGEGNGDVSCGEDGCGPQLTRDGSVDIESRWSCAQNLAPDGGLCQISFAFEDPQDIMDVDVALYKGTERLRTLQASANDEVVVEFDSSPATTFTALGLQGTGVETMTFTTVGLTESDWISLAEVRFLVEP